MSRELVERFQADMRDPYMGNTLPVIVHIYRDEDGYLMRVTVVSPEGIEMPAKRIDEDVQPLNK